MFVLQFLQNKSLSCLKRWEHGVLVLVITVLVDHLVAWKEEFSSGRPQIISAISDLDLHTIVLGRRHLAGHKSGPDKLVKPELVTIQLVLDHLRNQLYIRRTDRLVGILDLFLPVGEHVVCVVLLPVILCDIGFCCGSGLRRNAYRIRSQVGDQTGGAAFPTQIQPLV